MFISLLIITLIQSLSFSHETGSNRGLGTLLLGKYLILRIPCCLDWAVFILDYLSCLPQFVSFLIVFLDWNGQIRGLILMFQFRANGLSSLHSLL